jgi:hypothetical protein
MKLQTEEKKTGRKIDTQRIREADRLMYDKILNLTK